MVSDLIGTWQLAIEDYLQMVSLELYPEPLVLHQACRYALAGRGKRLRPLLTLATAHACGSSWQAALPAATAIEMLHTYSLVHDDLPCMDDDDLRRGRPTTHKAFDEGTALLTGDALLTDAFYVIAAHADYTATQKAQMLRLLAAAGGGRGMVYGQALDIAWTGREGYQQSDLDAIHQNKTGQLIRASCLVGAAVADVHPQICAQLQIFGDALGLAFQIVDDLIDEQENTGKTPGKDKAKGKLTYLTLMSASEARARAERLTHEALAALAVLPGPKEPLLLLADRLLRRSS